MTQGKHKKDVERVRGERESTYGSPASSMENLGLMITGLLRSRYPHLDIPPIDGDLVALMLVCLKLGRASRKTPTLDTYVDAHNYLDFAEESNEHMQTLSLGEFKRSLKERAAKHVQRTTKHVEPKGKPRKTSRRR